MMRHAWLIAAAALASLLVAPATVAQKSGVESSTGGPIYILPRDHALHTGHPIFQKSNDYMEWFYFTSFNKDEETGEPVTLFGVLNLQGWITATQQPFNSVIFSGHNMETGLFQNTLDALPKITTTGTGPGVGDKFRFSYTGEDATMRFNITYTYKDETWYFKSVSKNNKNGNQPYELDVKLKVYSPGYIGATASGIETEGVNPTSDWNPQTAYGLSYYTIAPQAMLTGTAKLSDGKLRKVKGAAWIEHQWGNFRGFSNLHSRYFWAWGRLDNGDLLTLRQWNTKDSKDVNNGPPDMSQSRFIYLKKLPGNQGFETQYATGPSMNFTVAKKHTISNGQEFPLWGKLQTPQGTFYLAPEFKDQAALTAAGPYFFEGVKYIYKDPELKQRIGRMFGEHIEIANKKFEFVRQAPKRNFARALNGSLPPLPAEAAGPFYPKHQIKNEQVKFA